MNFEKKSIKTNNKQENRKNNFLEPTKEEQKLLEGKIEEENIEIFGVENGCNEISFIKLENGSVGIFKSKQGERILRNEANEGTYFKRERAAYLVDRFLGFDMVPPTVIRKIKGRIGSFQQFIPDVNTTVNVISAKILVLPSWYRESIIKLWIFDYLIWNSDRHSDNFLVDPNEKLWAIDNGLSFGKDSCRFLYIPLDETIPKTIREKIIELNQDEEKKLILQNHLEKLLKKKEINAFFKRLNDLANFSAKNIEISHYKILFKQQ